jgi:hypothetical protein
MFVAANNPLSELPEEGFRALCIVTNSQTNMNPTSVEILPSFPDGCLNYEGEYQLRNAVFQAINTWVKTKGYAFTTVRSTAASQVVPCATYCYLS